MTTTTSLRQVQSREGLCGGSLSAPKVGTLGEGASRRTEIAYKAKFLGE
ncbi:hypothetical protein [uncultured Endozoicomonas sp.]|nr:hypothetical protein [uncultured Endozoicomonas sp.]